MTNFVRLSNRHSECIFDCRRGQPALLYWGTPLAPQTSPDSLALLHTRQEAPACAEKESPIFLCPTLGSGYLGKPGLELHDNGQQWAPHFDQLRVQQASDTQVEFISESSHTGLRLTHQLSLDKSGVLTTQLRLDNSGSDTFTLNHCAAATFALPAYLTQVVSLEGRWAKEFQLQTTPLFCGSFSRENRHGRTSHHCLPAAMLETSRTSENYGKAFGFHLGWSGNHQLHIETLADGRLAAQLGELFLPGEITLAPGEHYCSPTLFGVFSDRGRNGIRQSFHHFVRQQLLNPDIHSKPRPIHFNTWEAQYFDHQPETLLRLAQAAAEVGAERFVLDDGWFPGRRHDQTGLGDWIVDKEVYPQGLQPIIDRVNELGMEFGLWFEPEMVNPDSELYRQHPDWVLGCDDQPTLLARHQLALNLTLPEVQQYLFEHLDALLSEYNIGYIKWDMNRDLHQPGDHNGRAAVHRQTLALYQLLQRVREAHPLVEIETCASGGGRADFGILAHTDRVWTSDSNDALDRLAIQKGFTCFFPPEVMGSHVGPFDCHITGRKLAMETRAGVALFGHMGMEVNLLEESEKDLATLQSALRLHKQHRALIHSGRYVRLDTDEGLDAFGIVSRDQAQALFSCTPLQTHNSTLPSQLYFDGIDPDSEYQLTLIWPTHLIQGQDSILHQLSNDEGIVTTGSALQHQGLQLPLVHPHTVLVFELRRTGGASPSLRYQ